MAHSLANYLNRHAEIADAISKNGNIKFYTTDNKDDFNSLGSVFFGREIQAEFLELK